MKVLIINHNGGSPYHGPNLRTYYAAKSLVSQGHEVSIVAGAYSHKYSNLPFTNGVVTFEAIDGINYYWVKVVRYQRLLSRIFSHFQFGMNIILKRDKLPAAADIVIFSGPPPEVFLFSKTLSYLFDAPICCDVRDLWPLTQLQMSKLHILNPYVWFLYFCERYMFSRSVLIISPLQGLNNYITNKNLAAKVRVIPHGHDSVTTDKELDNVFLTASASYPHLGITRGERVELSKFRDRFFIVGYSGSIDRDNDTESIVLAALRIQDPDIIFVIIGDGVMKPALQRLAASSQNIIFFDRVIAGQVLNMLAHIDILYCGLRAKSIYRFGASPAKIYEYMAAAKPVIWAVDAYNDPVFDSGCGFSVQPGDISAISYAIMDLKRMPSRDRVEMGKRGHAHLLEHYSYDVLGRQWENALLEAVDGR